MRQIREAGKILLVALLSLIAFATIVKIIFPSDVKSNVVDFQPFDTVMNLFLNFLIIFLCFERIANFIRGPFLAIRAHLSQLSWISFCSFMATFLFRIIFVRNVLYSPTQFRLQIVNPFSGDHSFWGYFLIILVVLVNTGFTLLAIKALVYFFKNIKNARIMM